MKKLLISTFLLLALTGCYDRTDTISAEEAMAAIMSCKVLELNVVSIQVHRYVREEKKSEVIANCDVGVSRKIEVFHTPPAIKKET